MSLADSMGSCVYQPRNIFGRMRQIG